MEEVGFKAFMEEGEERDKMDEFSGEGTRMSAGNLFHRKGAVKVKD